MPDSRQADSPDKPLFSGISVALLLLAWPIAQWLEQNRAGAEDQLGLYQMAGMLIALTAIWATGLLLAITSNLRRERPVWLTRTAIIGNGLALCLLLVMLIAARF